MSSTTSNASTMSTSTASTTMILGVSTNQTYLQNCSEPQKPEINFTGIDFWVFESIWLAFCCSGDWSTTQPLRIVALFIGFFKALTELIILRSMRITLSWFVIYLLGRTNIETNRRGAITAVALMVWLLLDIAVDLIGDDWKIGYLLEGVSLAVFLAYLLTWTLVRYGRPGWCQLDRVITGIIWALGWIVLTSACCAGAEASVSMAGWFMLYPVFYPRVQAKQAGKTPPPQRRSGWLGLINNRGQGTGTLA